MGFRSRSTGLGGDIQARGGGSLKSTPHIANWTLEQLFLPRANFSDRIWYLQDECN
jgi:hypothetical protein